MKNFIKRDNTAIPGLSFNLGLVVSFISIIILIPFASVFFKTFELSFSEFLSIISDERAMISYRLTVVVALIATVINVSFGLLLAWVLTRYDFFGKKILDAVIDLPFALPTSVAGIALVSIYDQNGFMGQFFSLLGIKIAYTWVGIVIAMTFTSIPFGVRGVQSVLKNIPLSIEEAGISLGASKFYTFRKIIFPTILPAFFSGASASFARSLGEFGAIIFIAGNIPFSTEITSLIVMIKLDEFDYSGASAIASVILIFSLLILGISSYFQSKLNSKFQDN